MSLAVNGLPLSNEGTITIGYSAERRPLHATAVPSQHPFQRTVLLIGAIHGDEPEGPTVLNRLLNYLEKSAHRPMHTRLVILPAANPDGLARNDRRNANDVDINRNFPTGDWEDTKRMEELFEQRGIKPHEREPIEQYFGGHRAGSEPETQALISFIEEIRPDLIIQLHSTRPETVCPEGIVHDFGNPSIAKRMARATKLPFSEGVGYPEPGNSGRYAFDRWNITSITIEMPAGLTPQKAWAYSWPALNAAIEIEEQDHANHTTVE